MIKFASLCPHPPIIIPGIGRPEDLKLAKNTINAMDKLSEEIAKFNIDTVIIISPHGLICPDRFNIWYGGEFSGDFRQFGAPEIKFEFASNSALAKAIADSAENAGIKINHYTENPTLDHGVLVPMYYLSKHLPEEIKLIPINYTYQNAAYHFKFGQILKEVCNSSEFKNIAVIASGDLSHRLFEGGNGQEFDQKLIDDLKNKRVEGILNYDEVYLEEAGECGYRSIVILLGALDKLNYQPQILSYEGPFGVGYSVVNFKLDKI